MHSLEINDKTAKVISKLAKQAGVNEQKLIEKWANREVQQRESFKKLDAMRGKIDFDFVALKKMGIYDRSEHGK